ncbi:pupal cuticle protein 36-like [Homarus americanus]|uniref:pupal cuticle protein 36-like n=1 Tax=Homarus americanus TaxID=6706 RepID=UPI001C49707C|nr:pupal cuticle protein 36-like [Homarus americanus]
MKLLILAGMLAAATAGSLQSYSLPTPFGSGFSTGSSSTSFGSSLGGTGFFGGSGFSGSSGFSGGLGISGGSGFSGGSGISGGSGFSGGPGPFDSSCGGGQVRHVDGSCVTPQVTRNLFRYRVPPATPILGARPNVPPPRVEDNILFIEFPEELFNQEPIVVPPPQQRNVVYVLNKRPHQDHTVVHAPGPEQAAPEVFFVNYAEGENPTLPSGGDLQSALSSASDGSGELVGSSGGSISTSGLVSGGGSIGGVSGSVSGGGSGVYGLP